MARPQRVTTKLNTPKRVNPISKSIEGALDMTIGFHPDQLEKISQLIVRRTKKLFTPSKAAQEWYKEYTALIISNIIKDRLNVTANYNTAGGGFSSFEGVGYAFGRLQKSIKVNVTSFGDSIIDKKVDTAGKTKEQIKAEKKQISQENTVWKKVARGETRTISAGRVSFESLRYGDALQDGRMAAYVPISSLVGWITRKMAAGKLKAANDIGEGKKFKDVTDLAFAISGAKNKKKTPAQLPKWKKFDEHDIKKFRKRFDQRLVAVKFFEFIKLRIEDRRYGR